MILQKLVKTDALIIAQIANNFKIARNLTNKFPHPYHLDHAESFIDFAQNSSLNHLIRAIVIDDQLVGCIGLHPQSDVQIKNAELGYWLGEDYWGRGIITKAIPEMVKLGFETLDINRIFARPFGSNIASQKALEKCSFVLEAKILKSFYKFEEYEDELIYAIRKSK